MSFKEITDIDEILQLRRVGLIWLHTNSHKPDEYENISAEKGCKMTRREQLELLSCGCRYFINLED